MPGHLGRVVHGESGDLESKELRYPSDDVDDEPRRPAGGEDEDDDEDHLDNLPPALHDPVSPLLLSRGTCSRNCFWRIEKTPHFYCGIHTSGLSEQQEIDILKALVCRRYYDLDSSFLSAKLLVSLAILLLDLQRTVMTW